VRAQGKRAPLVAESASADEVPTSREVRLAGRKAALGGSHLPTLFESGACLSSAGAVPLFCHRPEVNNLSPNSEVLQHTSGSGVARNHLSSMLKATLNRENLPNGVPLRLIVTSTMRGSERGAFSTTTEDNEKSTSCSVLLYRRFIQRLARPSQPFVALPQTGQRKRCVFGAE